MDVLLKFMPLTCTIAVCRASAEAVVGVLVELGHRLQAGPRWDLPSLRNWDGVMSRCDALSWLLPLHAEAFRYVVTPCGTGWVAVFGNGAYGIDALLAGYVARLAKTAALTLQISPVGRAIYRRRQSSINGRFDALSFSMTQWSEAEQHDIPVRNVALISDPRPELILYGAPLGGEVADYETRRGRARVTFQDLARLCELLGVEVLDPKWRSAEGIGPVRFVDYGPSERMKGDLILPDAYQPDAPSD